MCTGVCNRSNCKNVNKQQQSTTINNKNNNKQANKQENKQANKRGNNKSERQEQEQKKNTKRDKNKNKNKQMRKLAVPSFPPRQTADDHERLYPVLAQTLAEAAVYSMEPRAAESRTKPYLHSGFE